MRTKGLQLAVFLVLSAILIPAMGLLGAAIAVVSSELLVQFGVLGRIILRQTLQHPLRHLAFLSVMMLAVILSGWALGTAIRLAMPLSGAFRFFAECALWFASLLPQARSRSGACAHNCGGHPAPRKFACRIRYWP